MMSFSPILAKILGFLLAIITPLLNFFLADLKGPFENEVEAALEKTGGYYT